MDNINEKKKTVKELQVEISEMEIEKSKLQEQYKGLELKQQGLSTQIYARIAEAYKKQAASDTLNTLLVPKNDGMNYGQN